VSKQLPVKGSQMKQHSQAETNRSKGGLDHWQICFNGDVFLLIPASGGVRTHVKNHSPFLFIPFIFRLIRRVVAKAGFDGETNQSHCQVG